METGLHHIQKTNEEKYFHNSKLPSPILVNGDADDTFVWEYNMRRQMQEIMPGVFLGPLGVALKCESLREAGITHILCLRQEAEAPFVRPFFPESFEYLVLNVADNPTENIIPHLSQATEFIDSCLHQGGKVLVHSNAGISRSATVVIGYVMEKLKMSSSDAMRLVQKKRFCIFPNEGFRTQLLEYEPIWKAKLSNSSVNDTGDTVRPKRSFCEDEAMQSGKDSDS